MDDMRDQTKDNVSSAGTSVKDLADKLGRSISEDFEERKARRSGSRTASQKGSQSSGPRPGGAGDDGATVDVRGGDSGRVGRSQISHTHTHSHTASGSHGTRSRPPSRRGSQSNQNASSEYYSPESVVCCGEEEYCDAVTYNLGCGKMAREDKFLETHWIGKADPANTLNEGFQPTSLPTLVFGGNPDASGIVLGPVIGQVTASTVRVMVETNFSGTLMCYLKGADSQRKEKHGVNKKVTVSANEPCHFSVQNLRPDYEYTVLFNYPVFDLVSSHFHTLADLKGEDMDLMPTKLALVSGNSVTVWREPVLNDPGLAKAYKQQVTSHATATSMWKDLYELINRDEVRMIVHVGNNVMIGGDKRKDGYSVLRQAFDDQLSAQDARELFVKQYHTAWNEPYTKHVLASCSNIMVANETDIGNFVEINRRDPAEIDHFMFLAQEAFNVYRLYQQRLSTKLDPEEQRISHLFSCVTAVVGPGVGLLTIDCRMVPTLHRHLREASDHELFGARQTRQISKALKELFSLDSGVRCLIVVSPVRLTDRHSFVHLPQFQKEMNKFLASLFHWRDDAPRNKRQVVLVSSVGQDVCCGASVGEIRRRHTPDHHMVHAPAVVEAPRQEDVLKVSSGTAAGSNDGSVLQAPIMGGHGSTVGAASVVESKQHRRRRRHQSSIKEFVVGNITAQPTTSSLVTRFATAVANSFRVGPIGGMTKIAFGTDAFSNGEFQFRASVNRERRGANSYGLMTVGGLLQDTDGKEDADIPDKGLVVRPHVWFDSRGIPPFKAKKPVDLARIENHHPQIIRSSPWMETS